MKYLFLLMPFFAFGQTYPDGVGFGNVSTTGGRGGVVRFVTNTNDTGAGSLRQAIADHIAGSGGSTIIFETGGTISLANKIDITRGDLTIAGQSAPGEGILIRRTQSATDEGALFIDGADNVIISGLRIRLGQHNATSGTTSQGDAITIYDGSDIYIRNCSLSWSTDETLGIYGDASTKIPSDITVHNVIIGEPLAYQSSHTYDANIDSRAMIVGGGSFNVSIYNLYIVASADRNPFIGGGDDAGIGHEIDGLLTNGLGAFATKFERDASGQQINIRNFVSKNRNSSYSTRRPIASENTRVTIARELGTFFNDQSFGGDDIFGLFEPGTTALNTSNLTNSFYSYPMSSFPARSQAEIENAIKNQAGAFPRDAVDTRLLGYIDDDTGLTLLREDTASITFPTLAAGTAPTDVDNDGIPDTYEAILGTSDLVANNNADQDSDGYTDLEEYLFSLLASSKNSSTIGSSKKDEESVISN